MSRIQRKIDAMLFKGDQQRMIAKNKIPDAQVSFERLKKLGFMPKTIFDVGAYQGHFSAMCLETWPAAQIVAFEALPQKIPMLRSKFAGQQVRILEGIVGSKDEDGLTFYADETASSVLKSEEVNTKKQLITQNMRRLDTLVREQGLPVPELLKIDTQGYEYEVLKGCGDMLEQIDALLLEVNFIEVYEHAMLAHEIIRFLADKGFVVYDICEIHRRELDDALFQIDFLFVKKDAALRRDTRWGIATPGAR